MSIRNCKCCYRNVLILNFALNLSNSLHWLPLIVRLFIKLENPYGKKKSETFFSLNESSSSATTFNFRLQLLNSTQYNSTYHHFSYSKFLILHFLHHGYRKSQCNIYVSLFHPVSGKHFLYIFFHPWFASFLFLPAKA